MSVPDRPRVAIVAADAFTALGKDLDESWSALLEGRTAVAPVTGFDASGFRITRAAQVWPAPAEPEEETAKRVLGRHGQLIDALLRRLHEAGGLAAAPRNRVGLYVLTGLTDSPIGDMTPAVLASRDDDGTFDVARFFKGGFRRMHPLWPLEVLQNVAIGQISIDLDIRGDNVVLSSEGDGAVRVVTEAAFALLDENADHVLVAGGSNAVSPAELARLTLRGDRCSPGEAAGALHLERDGGRRPRAYVLGGATAFERAEGRPGPTEDAFRRAIRGALDAAGVEGRDLDAVFLHAEGQADQDAAERRAVAELGDSCGLVATKGALGHTRGAAPVVDAALAVKAMETGVLPPTVGPDGVIVPPAEGAFRRILVLAAASHGGAGALVLEGAS